MHEHFVLQYRVFDKRLCEGVDGFQRCLTDPKPLDPHGGSPMLVITTVTVVPNDADLSPAFPLPVIIDQPMALRPVFSPPASE